jgi:Major Facilitator Superfamily
MDESPQTEPRLRRQAPLTVLAGAFLFNLGQGVLRPTLPLYLQQVFSANYRMVTLIPVVFGAGKWVANLPAGYLQDRLGRRRVMAGGLILIAVCDVASAMSWTYGVFLSLRALAGLGWAAFSTVATTTMVDRPGSHRHRELPAHAGTLEPGDRLGGGVRGGPADGLHRRPGGRIATRRCGRLVAHAGRCWPNPRPDRHGSRRRRDADLGDVPPGVRPPPDDRVAVSSAPDHTRSVTGTLVRSVPVAARSRR